MRDHRHADVAAFAGHDVEAALREACFVKHFGQHEGRKRRILGRFGDHRAAGDERRSELETEQRHRIVERRNRNHYADGLTGDDDLLAGRAGQRHLRMDAKALLGVDVHQVGRALHFGDCGTERAAELGRQHAADVAGAIAHCVGSFLLQPRPRRDRRLFPGPECALGGKDRNVGVPCIAGRYGVDHPARRRIDHIVPGARRSLYPTAVDEHVHVRSLSSDQMQHQLRARANEFLGRHLAPRLGL